MAPRLSALRVHEHAMALSCLAVLAAPTAVVAQDPRLPPARPTLERLIESVEPRAGPVGTRVRVSSVEMPMITPMWVGIGASRTGFEAFHELMTDLDGTFDVEMDIPAWAQWDRVHTFIAFDLYFRPIALSEPFHVTDDRGMVRRSGRIREAAPGCVGLEDEDGVAYALDGVSAGDHPPGEVVVVEGRIVLEPHCGMDERIRVTEIQRVGSP